MTTDICLQTSVCNCVFQRDEKKISQNLSHFKKELHFENEHTFRKRTTFWKWKNFQTLGLAILYLKSALDMSTKYGLL